MVNAEQELTSRLQAVEDRQRETMDRQEIHDVLMRYCRGADIWHTAYTQGYLGAFPESGFAAPLLARLWDQLVQALVTLAGLGLAHGDLSAYNLLVQEGRLVMIDLPQVVDVIAHPRGTQFLDRDAANVARWFTARGLAGASPAPAELAALLRQEARLA